MGGFISEPRLIPPRYPPSLSLIVICPEQSVVALEQPGESKPNGKNSELSYTCAVPNKPKPPPQFKVGDKILVNLHHGKIEDAVVMAVIEDKDGLKLQVDFGYEQTALIHAYQVVQD